MSSTAAINATFSDVEALVLATARRFAEKHYRSDPRRYFGGPDWEEVVCVAFEGFTLAYHSYDPSRAKFTTWVVNRIWYHLQNDQRAHITREKRYPREEVEPDLMPQQEAPRFSDDLSDDARAVVRLLLEAPVDLKTAVLEEGEEWKPERVKQALIRTLKDFGWTALRIVEAFGEIREALS